MSPDATPAVLNHHLESIIAVDVDALMADYDENSILITPDVTARGTGEIRGFFNEFTKALTPDFLAAFDMKKVEVDGDIAYIAWSVGDAVPLGSDTLVVTNGKIRVQTVAIYMAG